MKILSLSFGNLNSLEGRWEIDFTRPEYAADGIFAITGPTGSGKSTILDALCLALYGQTPRLGKVTKGGNEIMSRHAGECFAEVTFSTGKGTFRCKWIQHRARKRPGGELQAQKHELSEAITGQLLQSRIHETLAAIEEVTGMDFERFTRSMLLAQGGFAAFLQADPDRRAPVLEQITGTGIYSRISMRVHERYRAERTKLEQLRAETGNLRLLSDEEVAEREARLSRLGTDDTGISVQLETVSASLRRLGEIARLEEEMAGIDEQLSGLKREQEDFEPDASRLRLARIADPLEHRHAALVHQREELRREDSELAEKERIRPALQADTQREGQRHDEAAAAVQAAISAELNERPLHEQVMALDRSISEKRRECARLGQELDEAVRAFGNLGEERERDACSLEARYQEQAQIVGRLDSTSADEALATELSGIRHAFDELRAAEDRQAAARSELDGAETELDACRVLKSDGEQAAARAKARLEVLQHSLASLNSEYSRLIDGKGLKQLRHELDAARTRRKLLEELSGLYASGKEFAPRIEQVANEIRELETLRSEAEVRLGHVRELLAHGERQVTLLEENLRLAARVKSFEDERQRLSEGEPCPLCGSTTHPYAIGNGAAMPTEDEARLRDARETVRQQAGSVRDLELAVAGSTAAIGQRLLRRTELEDDRESYGHRCLGLLQETGIQGAPREAEPEVLEALSAAGETVIRLGRLVEEAEAFEGRIHDAESSMQSMLEQRGTVDLRLTQAVERFAAASREQGRLREAHEAARRDYASRSLALGQLLQPFGVHSDPAHDAATIIDGLVSRCKRRRADAERRRRLETEIVALQAAVSGLDERLASSGQELSGRQEAVRVAGTELDGLVSRRKVLFGDRDPVVEAARLAEAVVSARETFEGARESLARSRQGLGGLDASIAALVEGIGRRRETIATLESVFLDALSQKGFADEQAFIDARMPEGERLRFEQVAEGLQRREQELIARREDRASRMQQEQASLVDSRTPHELSITADQLQASLRTVREEIGAIRQQLAENERVSGELRQKAETIEAQATECRRWELLHDLIGSADGKKFRNFAQGLTFETMVTHANRQLASMTDRYLLVRDESIPLELNVIDTWQAGEVRSTRNLSGGESFIVSLALALGLSQMSSRNVRVDSLFLDEGFGTLDEEALETALETLGSLQQSGKLIGIISHVPALKERISTQIRVTPLTGGRSTIAGPGVLQK